MIIWIASYPKSGNTWVRAIIDSFLDKNNNEVDINNLKIRQFPLVRDFKGIITNFKSEEQFAKNCIYAQEKINLDNEIKFFKTHNAFWKLGQHSFTNETNSLGVIHVVRDPRNVITSILNHFNKTINTYDKALKFITDDKRMFGPEALPLLENDLPTIISSWSNHYNSWKKFKKNNLLIKYENLLINPKNEFYKIAIFLEKTINLKIDQKTINNAIKNTQFIKLKTQENKSGFRESAKNINNENLNFFYLGPENNWRKLLDLTIINKIEQAFNKEMKELNYL
tara:strand:+ start:415 stop:1260 length:846 start_codon:yes stop_codon:yes gene_type:complete